MTNVSHLERIRRAELRGYDERPSPCQPSMGTHQCQQCARFAPNLPTDPMQRRLTVLLDASIAPQPRGLCTLFVVKPIEEMA